MPPAVARLACVTCGDQFAELPMNAPHFTAAIYRLRREHARAVHHWPGPPEVVDAPAH